MLRGRQICGHCVLVFDDKAGVFLSFDFSCGGR